MSGLHPAESLQALLTSIIPPWEAGNDPLRDTLPQELKSSFSSCYSSAACIWAMAAAGTGWSLFPTYLLPSPLLATTETTWLVISDSRRTLHCPAAGTTCFPPSHLLPHLPTSALRWGAGSGVGECTEDVRGTQLQFMRFQCLHRDVEPQCNLGVCWLKNTKQTSDCVHLCTHQSNRKAKMVKKIMVVGAFHTNAEAPGDMAKAKMDILQREQGQQHCSRETWTGLIGSFSL